MIALVWNSWRITSTRWTLQRMLMPASTGMRPPDVVDGACGEPAAGAPSSGAGDRVGATGVGVSWHDLIRPAQTAGPVDPTR
jgi:hypothetical protein